MSAVLDALRAAPSFSEARVQRRALAELHKEERHALQAEYDAAVVAAWTLTYPKRKRVESAAEVAGRKDGPEVIEATRGPFDERAKKMVDDQEKERDAADRRMRDLAAEHPSADTRDEVWSLVDTVYQSSYRDQTDSRGYARRAAEARADWYTDRGLKAKVVYVPTSYGGQFWVWVGTDHETAHAIRILGPAVDIIEIVRRCWARQVNPRVYYPFLPHGFEEQHGIDYQGRRTR